MQELVSGKVQKWRGGAITAPGIYSDVPMATYHGKLVPEDQWSVSRSGIWTTFSDSPAHYWHGCPYNPNAEAYEQSQPLLFGRAAHHLILGEANFKKHFVIRPDEFDSWRTNASKEWRAEQWYRGLDVLIPENLDAIVGMAKGLAAHPLVRGGILSGLIEHTMVARDPETGIWLKIRPDAIPQDGPDVSDFKTCADISDEGIEEAIGRDGLFVQGALIRKVFRILGRPFSSFSLVFSEKAEPHCCRVKTLKDCDLDLGETIIDASLQTIARCIDRSVWPGPGGEQTDAEYVEMRPYHRKRFEDRLQKLQQEIR